jgi:prepilin-type N-terminal cleavage/methylation domain-containing protein/prepilin-type processing-associated H-X9-DG protein
MVRFPATSRLFALLLAALATCGIPLPCQAQSQWLTPGFGLWNDPLNWSDGVPNAPGASALFGPGVGPEAEVVIDLAPITLGQLLVESPGFLTVSGTQPLVLATAGETPLPRIDVSATTPPVALLVPLQGNEGLEKSGGGELLLDGPLNYFGTTLISQGALALGPGSALPGNPVIVRGAGVLDVSSHPSYQLAPNQQLAGGGTIVANTLVVGNDNLLLPGDGVGNLTIAGSLQLQPVAPVSAGGIAFELSADPIGGPANNDSIQVAGDVSVFGVHQLFITPIDNQLAVGSYPLLTYGGTLNAGGGILQPVHQTRLTMSVDTSQAGEISLDVSGGTAQLLWEGTVNNQWDIGTTANWTGGGGLYFDLDAVRFDDTALEFQVAVAQDVRPASVLFQNSDNAYEISGPGAIRGAARLTISGGGQVSFLNQSEFGTVDVPSGTLAVGPGSQVAASTTATIGATGELQLQGGTLLTPQAHVLPGGRLTGSGTIAGNVRIGDGSGNTAVALLSPGASPGTVEIQGDLTLEENSETLIEISGTSGNPHDMVIISGEATLDGVLRIDGIDGYQPQVGDTFTILTSGLRAEESVFADVQAVRAGDVIMWPCYDGGNVVVTGELVGDMDLSGVIDVDDIPFFAFALRDNEGYDDALLCTEFEVADMDGNSRVDFGDIHLFATKVQQSGTASMAEVLVAIHAALAVPEPTALSLLLLGMACRSPRRRTHVPRATASRAGFTLVELLTVVAILGVLIGLLLPAVQAAREAARRSQCTNHQKQLALALHAYEAQHGVLPAGARAHRQPNGISIGWQVDLLPHIEQQSLYEQISPDQNGGALDHNLAVYSVPVFHCPAAEPPAAGLETKKGSNYVGVAGAGRGAEVWNLEDTSCGDVFLDGVLEYGEGSSSSRVIDGTSHTLAVGERVYLLEEWTFGAKWRGDPVDRICIGSIKNLRYPPNASLEHVGYYVRDFSVPGGQRTMVRNDLLFGSEHPGGVYFSFADGSVHFLADEIDFTVVQDLASCNGQELNRWKP